MKLNRIIPPPILVWLMLLAALKADCAQFILGKTGHAATSGQASQVAVAGHYAYVANGTDGLRVYDYSNPTNPISIADTNNGGTALGVTVAGQYAYLADGTNGFFIYDISNPTNIFAVGSDGFGVSAWSVVVANKYAYLAYDIYGLIIYDISNPSQPQFVGYTGSDETNYGLGYDVALAGQYAYLADGPDGIRIYNVSDPTQPTAVAHISDDNNPGSANGVAVSGHYLFIANGVDGLRIYDISNPAIPIFVSHRNDGAYAYSVTASGNFVFVADYFAGLLVYDVSNPAAPIELNFPGLAGFGPNASALSVTIADSFLYLADGADGVRSFQLLPTLKINATDTNQLSLTWPLPCDGYQLQQSPSGTGTWTTLTNLPSAVAGQNEVVIPAPGTNQFYRLLH